MRVRSGCRFVSAKLGFVYRLLWSLSLSLFLSLSLSPCLRLLLKKCWVLIKQLRIWTWVAYYFQILIFKMIRYTITDMGPSFSLNIVNNITVINILLWENEFGLFWFYLIYGTSTIVGHKCQIHFILINSFISNYSVSHEYTFSLFKNSSISTNSIYYEYSFLFTRLNVKIVLL